MTSYNYTAPHSNGIIQKPQHQQHYVYSPIKKRHQEKTLGSPQLPSITAISKLATTAGKHKVQPGAMMTYYDDTASIDVSEFNGSISTFHIEEFSSSKSTSMKDDLLGSLSYISSWGSVASTTSHLVQQSPSPKHKPENHCEFTANTMESLILEELMLEHNQIPTEQQQTLPSPPVTTPITNGHHDQNSKNELIQIEIVPGIMAPLYGAEETSASIETDSYAPCICMACNEFLFCIHRVTHVICPKCKIISMNESSFTNNNNNDDDPTIHNLSVGLGFTVEQLITWKQWILDRREQSK